MDITVRPARADDVEAIAAVNLASWEAAYRGIVVDAFLDNATLEGRVTQWAERIRAGDHPILVAEAGGRLVGYCSLALPARDAAAGAGAGGAGGAGAGAAGSTGEIGAIYVTPEWFRSGAGSAMVDAALDLMRARGFSAATLWVLAENAGARAFYARQGFHADGAVHWIDRLEAEELRLRREL